MTDEKFIEKKILLSLAYFFLITLVFLSSPKSHFITQNKNVYTICIHISEILQKLKLLEKFHTKPVFQIFNAFFPFYRDKTKCNNKKFNQNKRNI